MKVPRKLKRQALKQLKNAEKENPELASSSHARKKMARSARSASRQIAGQKVMTFPYKAGDLVMLYTGHRRNRNKEAATEYVTIVEVLNNGQNFSVMTNAGTLVTVSGRYLSPI